jgi:hypothetical protein
VGLAHLEDSAVRPGLVLLLGDSVVPVALVVIVVDLVARDGVMALLVDLAVPVMDTVVILGEDRYMSVNLNSPSSFASCASRALLVWKIDKFSFYVSGRNTSIGERRSLGMESDLGLD